MRLFIALVLSDEAKNALAQTQLLLKRAGVRGSYVPESNFHITLAFIGEYGDPARVLSVLRSAGDPRFSVTIGGIGAFRGVLWAGADGGRALFEYAAKIRGLLENAGIPYDKKRFSPHITLLRGPDRTEIPAEAAPAVTVRCAHAALMRSDRGEHGMIYTEIK